MEGQPETQNRIMMMNDGDEEEVPIIIICQACVLSTVQTRTHMQTCFYSSPTILWGRYLSSFYRQTMVIAALRSQVTPQFHAANKQQHLCS